jgi:peptidoglycan-associated lipoprotein
MHKYLIIILLSITFSCQNSSIVKTDSEKKPEISINENSSQNSTAFETINSEEQARKANEVALKEEEVEVQDRIYFAVNSSEVNEESKKILDVQAEWLKSDPSISITIEGHCDERGSREFNIALGEKRAFATKKYLKQKGIADSRLKIVSYGKERPAFIGNSDDIHAKNRRAVVVIN